MGESFSLYDLEVSVVGDPASFVCFHRLGHAFSVQGEDLVFEGAKAFSLYSLSALLPLLPAKQRPTHVNDWMTTDDLIACPDPHCGAKFKIERKSTRDFKHNDVTKVPLN